MVYQAEDRHLGKGIRITQRGRGDSLSLWLHPYRWLRGDMTGKPWYLSKMVWLNVLTGLSMFLALPELLAVVGENAVAYFLLTQAAINIVLRLTTTSTLTK